MIIFGLLLTNISVAEQRKTTDDSHIRSEAYTDVAFSSLVIISVISFGRWLTPLDEWHAEIHKLTEDEHFVERWMLLNDDPASLERGNRGDRENPKGEKSP